MSYQKKVRERAFKAFVEIGELGSKLDKRIEEIGWGFQIMSYLIFKECGVYELYEGNSKIKGRFISDRLVNDFYSSNNLDEFYDKLNFLLLEMELENGKH